MWKNNCASTQKNKKLVLITHKLFFVAGKEKEKSRSAYRLLFRKRSIECKRGYWKCCQCTGLNLSMATLHHTLLAHSVRLVTSIAIIHTIFFLKKKVNCFKRGKKNFGMFYYLENFHVRVQQFISSIFHERSCRNLITI